MLTRKGSIISPTTPAKPTSLADLDADEQPAQPDPGAQPDEGPEAPAADEAPETETESTAESGAGKAEQEPADVEAHAGAIADAEKRGRKAALAGRRKDSAPAATKADADLLAAWERGWQQETDAADSAG